MTAQKTPKDSFEAIQMAVLPKSGIPLRDLSSDLVQSVIYDAYKNCAIQEAIYDASGDAIAFESLCHPIDEAGREYPIEELANHCYERGLAVEFDTLTSSLGIKKAEQTGNVPITLNISVESALTPEFFEGIHKRVLDHGLKPQDVVFEILEHNVDKHADVTHLHALKGLGYRFALDDFGRHKSHSNRLHVFGDLVDFIKVDGPYVRGYLEDGFNTQRKDGRALHYSPEDLGVILGHINGHYERAGKKTPTLVAERVRNQDEIKKLTPLGFEGFQSRELHGDAFTCNFDPYEMEEQLQLVGQNGACDYD